MHLYKYIEIRSTSVVDHDMHPVYSLPASFVKYSVVRLVYGNAVELLVYKYSLLNCLSVR